VRAPSRHATDAHRQHEVIAFGMRQTTTGVHRLYAMARMRCSMRKASRSLGVGWLGRSVSAKCFQAVAYFNHKRWAVRAASFAFACSPSNWDKSAR
jgi:hypothetical protein